MRTLKASATPIHTPLNFSASLNAIVRVFRWNIPRSNATRKNMKRMNAAHNHIEPSGSEDPKCWSRAFFFALDLPLLLVPLRPALTEAKSGRKYRGTLRIGRPTASRPCSRMDAPVGGAPPTGMSGCHSDTAPAQSRLCWSSVLDFRQTAAGKNGAIEANALDVP